MNILIIHPLIQLTAIVVICITAYFGFQRVRSLHFGAKVKFKRNLHAALGATGLITILMGLAGGLIMVARVLDKQPLSSLHGKGGMVLLPFILAGIFSGFYLYVYPPRTKALSVIHGLNNLIILVLILFQIITGIPLALTVLAG